MQAKLLYRCYGLHYQRHWSRVHDEAFLWVRLLLKLLSGKSGETFFCFFSRIRTDQSHSRELSNGPLSCLEHHYTKRLCEQHKPSDYPFRPVTYNMLRYNTEISQSLSFYRWRFSLHHETFANLQLLQNAVVTLAHNQGKKLNNSSLSYCKQHQYVITVIKPLLKISLELQRKNANM